MKFLVQCPELRGSASQKSLKYDITKGQTLEQHIANIHRSLELVGVELSRPPVSYSLQVADRKGDPVKLEDGEPFLFEEGMVDVQLQMISDFAKRQRLRDLSVLLVPSPRVRANELIAGLSSGDSVKESAYNLRSCLQDEQFLEHFVDREGLSKLLEVLPSCKGNALAYTIAALHTTLCSSSTALKELVSKHGQHAISMIYNLLIDSCQVLSASRFVVDVLRLALTVEGGYALVEEAAKQDSGRLFSPMVSILLSEDLHSRLSGMRFITTVLQSAPPDAVERIVEALAEQAVAAAMQESVWIKHSDIRAELDLFERVSGIVLDRTSALCIPEGTEEELKAKIRELANQLMALKGELSAMKQLGTPQAEKIIDALVEEDLKQAESICEHIRVEEKAAVEEGKTVLAEEEREAIQREAREETEAMRQKLENELKKAEVVIAEQEEKIRCLKHTTGVLVSDSTIGEEERKALAASLESKAHEKGNDAEESEENGDTEALKTEKSRLESEVDRLKKEQSEVSIETYQSRLKLAQINQELEQLDEQKRKVQQVVNGLEQRNFALRETLADVDEKMAQARVAVKSLKAAGVKEKEKLRALKKKQDEKHATLRGADELLTYEEMQQKVSKMEQLVMVTSREKKEFLKEITDLKEKLAAFEASPQ